MTREDLEGLTADHVFDGGALDCGSGLILLIRQNMQQVPEGGVLELRSLEATVRDDLPPWCRMVGHAFLGELGGSMPGQARFFVRRALPELGDGYGVAEGVHGRRNLLLASHLRCDDGRDCE